MEIKSYESFVHALLERNPKLKEDVKESFEDNPNQEHPNPRIREIIEKHAHPENKERYLKIAAKHELGEVSPYEDDFDVVLWLKDWYCFLSWNYTVSYIYGRMEAMKGIHDRMPSILGTSIDPIKFLAQDSDFSESDIKNIIENWDTIKQAWDDMLAEDQRQLDKINREIAKLRELRQD